MRIDFHVEGGLAAFPGLAKPVTLHCDALPPDERAHLTDLVRRSDFFALPPQDPQGGGPDTRAYTIAIDDGARCRTVKVREPIANPALRDLIDALRQKAVAVKRAK
ncbi:MAG TPA: protealysin inhibitor emfourin [Casimicrobiaceae bacterium]|nr:protealysin inhibitor emfourin [Casimicrobiaceae bacterium]